MAMGNPSKMNVLIINNINKMADSPAMFDFPVDISFSPVNKVNLGWVV